MPDAIFEHPRLVAVYDAFEPDRSDLDVYVDLVHELGARHVLDVGCGTGVLALLLVDRGLEVTGLDPAAGSLAVARGKPGADRVRWLLGDAAAAPAGDADVATMTGNVAQAIADPHDWDAGLDAVHDALRDGGHLVLETRVPSRRAWDEWTPALTRGTTDVPGVGPVETWTEVTDVSLPLVTFRRTWVFASDGAVLTSDSTLRFRERDEVVASLAEHGFTTSDVREAPDRPGRELVFIARTG